MCVCVCARARACVRVCVRVCVCVPHPRAACAALSVCRHRHSCSVRAVLCARRDSRARAPTARAAEACKKRSCSWALLDMLGLRVLTCLDCVWAVHGHIIGLQSGELNSSQQRCIERDLSLSLSLPAPLPLSLLPRRVDALAPSSATILDASHTSSPL